VNITPITQEAARAEILISRITPGQWGKGAVLDAVKTVSTGALRHLACEQMKWAGIFTAGRQLGDWLWEEVSRREKENI
jgi:hypothetical protein